MKHIQQQLNSIKAHILMAVMSLVLLSCGSVVSSAGSTAGGVAGISGTGIVFGIITGFGSIFVNGVEYELDDSTTFDVNGNTVATQQDLAIGMAVKLKVSEDSNGVATASSVFYDEEIKGAITSDPIVDTNNAQLKSFDVLGDKVIINDVTTSFDGISFSTIQKNDVVEVSGLRDESGSIVATRVKKEGTFSAGVTEVEIHGTVANLTSTSFVLGVITINYTNAVELEDLSSGIADGQMVEVKGILQTASSVTASKIQGEDDEDSDYKTEGNELSLQGYVTSLVGTDGFVLNGINVTIDAQKISSTLFTQVSVGSEVEVKGVFQNNTLLATELEIRDTNASLEGEIKGINLPLKRLELGFNGVVKTILVNVTNTTKLEDESSHQVDSLTLNDLAIGDKIQAKFIVSDASNTLVVLKREESLEEYEVKGTLDAKDTINQTVTVFGVTFSIDSNASTSEVAEFYSKASIGDKVELKDTDKNGKIDELSVSD